MGISINALIFIGRKASIFETEQFDFLKDIVAGVEEKQSGAHAKGADGEGERLRQVEKLSDKRQVLQPLLLLIIIAIMKRNTSLLFMEHLKLEMSLDHKKNRYHRKYQLNLKQQFHQYSIMMMKLEILPIFKCLNKNGYYYLF